MAEFYNSRKNTTTHPNTNKQIKFNSICNTSTTPPRNSESVPKTLSHVHVRPNTKPPDTGRLRQLRTQHTEPLTLKHDHFLNEPQTTVIYI